MKNNKQSSVVDFIYNELFVVKRWMDLTPGDIEYIFKQAKAKHEEEIKDAWDAGDYCIDLPDGSWEQKYKSAEQYYNETFGSQTTLAQEEQQ